MTARRWIRFSIRLPEHHQEILVTDGVLIVHCTWDATEGRLERMDYIWGHDVEFDRPALMRWMPIPSLPRVTTSEVGWVPPPVKRKRGRPRKMTLKKLAHIQDFMAKDADRISASMAKLMMRPSPFSRILEPAKFPESVSELIKPNRKKRTK